ncbi:uncharacterized protein LOC108263784 [Ictalurus punctatus]|uniref:Uncharacterized protein LOC108263784 n=1 Tax=Ictalurus punctatus TaxID=7998 RepID=A0A979EQ21_ICTPU|nr:uncharacterized protein LOC108263784 [Ictalurus punctatus]
MVMTLKNKIRFAFLKSNGTSNTTAFTILCPWLLLSGIGAQNTIPSISTEERLTTSPRTAQAITSTTEFTTQSPTSTATPSLISGSAVVLTKMVFNSSSPVPSESLVLNTTQTLLRTRLTNLSDSVKVLNFTHEKISDTSYAVNITFSISNISMPSNPDLRNDTYTQVENIINNTVNTLLNNSGSDPLKPTTSNFTSSEKEVTGYMEYNLKVSLNQTGNGRFHHNLIILLNKSVCNFSF